MSGWQYSDGNPPNGGVECRWSKQKSRFWAYISLYLLLALQHARCCQQGRRWMIATDSQVMTHRWVSGGVDCGRRRRNVYDKKPRRYAKSNRTAHLTARSDKSVAYVTNNKRLYSTFCSIEANYWQTWSIARSLCDSRATCWLLQIPLLSVPCLSVRCLSDVCKHDFCKKALSDFSETLSVYCCRGLVVRNEKLFRPKI